MSFIGKIYKITSSKTDDVYIGSTIQTLNDRFIKHKSNYKLYQNKKYANVSSNEILKHGDAIIELIEEKEFKNKYDMLLCEGEHIKSNKKCVNQIYPVIPQEEQHAYKCPCGGSYNGDHKRRHLRTKMHKSYEEKEERAININITFNMTINDSEVKIITNGNDVK